MKAEIFNRVMLLFVTVLLLGFRQITFGSSIHNEETIHVTKIAGRVYIIGLFSIYIEEKMEFHKEKLKNKSSIWKKLNT